MGRHKPRDFVLTPFGIEPKPKPQPKPKKQRLKRDWELGDRSKNLHSAREGLCCDPDPPSWEKAEVYRRIAEINAGWSDEERAKRQVVKPREANVIQSYETHSQVTARRYLLGENWGLPTFSPKEG